MHSTLAVASLCVSLAAAPAPAATAEDFFASLQAPVSLEDVAVDVADDELEISFNLREVDQVVPRRLTPSPRASCRSGTRAP